MGVAGFETWESFLSSETLDAQARGGADGVGPEHSGPTRVP